MERQKEIYRVTIIGSIGNALLVVLKFVAGIVGHSSAMIADAVHSLSDFVTDIIVLLFVRISGKPCDADHQYGHGKYETLATAIIGMMLIAVGLGLFWDGAHAMWGFFHGKPIEEPGWVALIVAILSILVKEGLFRYTYAVGKRINSMAMIANAWHHRSDAFSSIATTIGIGGAILLGAKWRVLDPIAAALVSVMIVKVGFSLFLPSINELLDKSLPVETEKEILDTINSIPQISQPHNLRTRRIGPVCSIEVHVRMDANMTVGASHEITRELEAKLRSLLGPETLINIHVEPVKG